MTNAWHSFFWQQAAVIYMEMDVWVHVCIDSSVFLCVCVCVCLCVLVRLWGYFFNCFTLFAFFILCLNIIVVRCVLSCALLSMPICDCVHVHVCVRFARHIAWDDNCYFASFKQKWIEALSKQIVSGMWNGRNVCLLITMSVKTPARRWLHGSPQNHNPPRNG